MGLGKKEGWCFCGEVDTPMHTMYCDFIWPPEKSFVGLNRSERVNLSHPCLQFVTWHVAMWSRVMWLFGWVPFDVHRSCGSGDITFLFCRVSSHDLMIKGAIFAFISGSPSTYVTTLKWKFSPFVTWHHRLHDQSDRLGQFQPLNHSHHCAKINAYKIL